MTEEVEKNKELRHKVYLRTLELYSEDISTNPPATFTGLCFFLNKASKELYYRFGSYSNLEDGYPEIYNHKPLETYNSFYWWDLEDTTTRIKVLSNAIKATE